MHIILKFSNKIMILKGNRTDLLLLECSATHALQDYYKGSVGARKKSIK